MTRVVVVCAMVAVCWPHRAATAATMREARMTIVFAQAACEVTALFTVDTAGPIVIDHRLMLNAGGAPPDMTVVGALAGSVDVIGRTARIPISLTGTGRHEYRIRHRMASGGEILDRCPLLVPSVPTDGLDRAVRLEVELPAAAARSPGDFPAFTWEGLRGAVTIGHVPSFVRVPHVPRGAALEWRHALDFRRLVDLAAIAAIGLSTLAWAALRKRHV